MTARDSPAQKSTQTVTQYFSFTDTHTLNLPLPSPLQRPLGYKSAQTSLPRTSNSCRRTSGQPMVTHHHLQTDESTGVDPKFHLQEEVHVRHHQHAEPGQLGEGSWEQLTAHQHQEGHKGQENQEGLRQHAPGQKGPEPQVPLQRSCAWETLWACAMMCKFKNKNKMPWLMSIKAMVLAHSSEGGRDS